MIRILIFVISVAVAAWWLTRDEARATGPVLRADLAEVLARPTAFEGHHVTLTGTVRDRVSVLGLGGVVLADGQGNEILVAGWTSPPTPGTAVTLTGRFVLALSTGTLEWPLLLMEEPP